MVAAQSACLQHAKHSHRRNEAHGRRRKQIGTDFAKTQKMDEKTVNTQHAAN